MLAEEKNYETCTSQKEALTRRRTSETCKTFQEIDPRLGTITSVLLSYTLFKDPHPLVKSEIPYKGAWILKELK